MNTVLFKIVCLWLLFINPLFFFSVRKKTKKTLIPCTELQKHNALPLAS